MGEKREYRRRRRPSDDMENPVLSAEMKFAIIICCELENNSDIEGE